jgi:hypothetical protein
MLGHNSRYLLLKLSNQLSQRLNQLLRQLGLSRRGLSISKTGRTQN